MIRCRHCEQWFMPTDPRTTMWTFIGDVPFCQHPGLRLATAAEIAARDRDYQRRVLDGRPLRTTPASVDPIGADTMLRLARLLLLAVRQGRAVADSDDLRDWLEVFDRRDAAPVDEASPRCGWG